MATKKKITIAKSNSNSSVLKFKKFKNESVKLNTVVDAVNAVLVANVILTSF